MQVMEIIKRHQAEHQAEWVSAGLWKNRTIADEALLRAEAQPEDPMIYLEDHALTSGEVMGQALALAAALQRMGLCHGDVVSFQLPNWQEAAILNIAAAYLGLVLCPIIPIYRSKELAFILHSSRAKLHFSTDYYHKTDYRRILDQLMPSLPDLQHVIYIRPRNAGSMDFRVLVENGKDYSVSRPSVDPNSIKLLLYTSGTTGVPKGVLHSHNTVRCAMENSARFWGIGPEDVMLMPSPVTHITGLAFGLELPFYAGNKTALMEKWNAAAARDFIQRVGATLCVSATPFLQELVEEVKHGHSLPSLRLFACGGAAVPPELILSVEHYLPQCRAVRVYGSTETPMVTQGFVGENELQLAAHTDGKIFQYNVKVVDAQDRVLSDNQEGEILAHGPSMFLGYADCSHNADAFDESGYFRTGDLGYLTPEEGIVITGRKKDLIIRGGENISAKEIEDVLHSHTGVREVSVVSMPHPRLVESVCAYVIPQDMDVPPTLQSLVAACESAGLAKQKWPERVEIVADFPRTPSGKIKKNELRDTIWQKLMAD